MTGEGKRQAEQHGVPVPDILRKNSHGCYLVSTRVEGAHVRAEAGAVLFVINGTNHPKGRCKALIYPGN